MNKSIVKKCVVGILAVALLGGCSNSSEGQASKPQNSESQVSQAQSTPVQSSAVQDSQAVEAVTAQAELEKIRNELYAIEKEEDELEDALEFALKGRELQLNERAYFEGRDKKIYCAGGSGESTSSLKFLQGIYPDLQIPEKLLEYTFDEAEIHAMDNMEYTQIDTLPQGKKLGEIYKVELKKENIVAAYFDYQNNQEDFEIKVFSNEGIGAIAIERIKAKQEMKSEYGVYLENIDDFILTWANDKYTFLIEADSQGMIDKLIDFKISEKFVF